MSLCFVIFFLNVLGFGYLNEMEYNALYDVYLSLDGMNWMCCNWNFTNNNNEYYVMTPCGNVWCSEIDGCTATHKLQNVWGITFYGSDNEIQCFGDGLKRMDQNLCRLKHLTEIFITNVPNLNGYMPACSWERMNDYEISNQPELILNTSNLIGLCGTVAPYGIVINLEFIQYYGDIPLCLMNIEIETLNLHNLTTNDDINVTELFYYPQSRIQLLSLIGDNFIGYLPDMLCNYTSLLLLSIIDTRITGTIPNCIGNLYQLSDLYLVNNRMLTGSVPYLPGSNKMHNIGIFGNTQLSGEIFNSFKYVNFSGLSEVYLHNNNFIDYNFESFMTNILTKCEHLQALSLHGNNIIYGSWPSNIKNIEFDNLHSISIHNLNIKGKIGPELKFYIGFCDNNYDECLMSFYGNQLSSNLPNDMINTSFIDKASSFIPIFLKGNLFYFKNDHSVPSWLNNFSQFASADNLYLTLYDYVFSWFYSIFAVIALILIMLIYGKRAIKYFENSKDNQYQVLNHLEIIIRLLVDWKLILFVIILCGFYYLTSNYYVSTPILSNFSLYFFDTDLDHVWIGYMENIGICVLILIFNVIIVSKLIQLHALYKIELNIKHLKSHLLLNYDNASILSDNMVLNCKRKIYNFIMFLIYFLGYICIILVTFIYFLLESIPKNNILNLNQFA